MIRRHAAPCFMNLLFLLPLIFSPFSACSDDESVSIWLEYEKFIQERESSTNIEDFKAFFKERLFDTARDLSEQAKVKIIERVMQAAHSFVQKTQALSEAAESDDRSQFVDELKKLFSISDIALRRIIKMVDESETIRSCQAEVVILAEGFGKGHTCCQAVISFLQSNSKQRCNTNLVGLLFDVSEYLLGGFDGVFADSRKDFVAEFCKLAGNTEEKLRHLLKEARQTAREKSLPVSIAWLLLWLFSASLMVVGIIDGCYLFYKKHIEPAPIPRSRSRRCWLRARHGLHFN